MGISFQKALDIHPTALQFRVLRSEVLSANLANVDTPNFKARDINFAAAMKQAQYNSNIAPTMQYRVPFQASQDGNTVELSVEQAEFAKNSMDFETSLTFLNMKLAGLRKAVEGK